MDRSPQGNERFRFKKALKKEVNRRETFRKLIEAKKALAQAESAAIR